MQWHIYGIAKDSTEKTSRLSDLKPIVGGQLLGADTNIDGFKGSALAQAPQLPRKVVPVSVNYRLHYAKTPT